MYAMDVSWAGARVGSRVVRASVWAGDRADERVGGRKGGRAWEWTGLEPPSKSD